MEKAYTAKPEIIEDKHFTVEQLHALWPQYIERYADQVHIYNSLSGEPLLEEDYTVVLKAENSVLMEKMRFLKPEMIGYLRRNLQNSKIDIRVDLLKAEETEKILSPEQKLKAMVQKNPSLALFKNKFNLDFSS